MTHGHTWHVERWESSLWDLCDEAKRRGARVAIFGHTHMPFLEEQNDILLLNPGSVAKPRQAGLKKTYAVITINDRTGEMKVRMKSLKGMTGWV